MFIKVVITGMYSFMDVKWRLLRKAFQTYITTEWSFASMGP